VGKHGNQLVDNKNAHHTLGITGNWDMEVVKDTGKIIPKVRVWTINPKTSMGLNFVGADICNHKRPMGLMS